MNDIEILENYVKELNENKKNHKSAYNAGFGKYWSDFGIAIENLIKRNKDLEQIEKEHKEENGRLRDKIKELEGIYNTAYNIGKSYINIKWKSKIKEKIEELNKEEKEAQESISNEEREEYSDASIGYLLMNIETRRNVLQELLEESDK